MLFELTLIDFSIQWAGCIHAVLSHTERFYDLIGALTNIFMVVYSYYYSSRSFQQLVCSLTITLWASRLGTFLFYRVLSAGEDKRFRKAKSSPLTMFVFWTLQGTCILLLLQEFTTTITTMTTRQTLTMTRHLDTDVWSSGSFGELTNHLRK
eukprot:TRINITY_DN166_c0_g1_i2.p1 TRINITY_DN166_c0_g1~~TRINITY_DN166_c0_g1_i2.p1  ORF type:complete len:175 (-),score=26.40 TRINITY_DN166_c0_g1_i2:493-948(-)